MVSSAVQCALDAQYAKATAATDNSLRLLRAGPLSLPLADVGESLLHVLSSASTVYALQAVVAKVWLVRGRTGRRSCLLVGVVRVWRSGFEPTTGQCATSERILRCTAQVRQNVVNGWRYCRRAGQA